MTTCNCSSACPDAVPTINRTEVTVDAYPDVELVLAPLPDSQEWDVTATVSIDCDLPWLIRFWFVNTITTAGLNQEVLNPPETPGINQFFKVTDADTNAISFRVANPSASGQWYLCAAVVGRVSTSSEQLVFPVV